MPTPEELQQDSEFMSATPADQIKYLSETDPDFKAAHSDDQAAYLAHVTKQPTQAEDTGGIAGAVKTALNYYTGQAKPPVMHVEAAPKQAKQATEETDPYAGMSEEDQKAEAALESQAGAPFHPRAKGFEQLSAAGAKLGGQITEGLVHGMGETPVTGFEQAPEHVSTEEFEKQHPKLAGASKGVGEFAGGMVADPRMWAFALLPGAEAAPLLNTLVSGAFAAQMGSDAVQGAKDLGENWDKMSEMDRYNAMSKLGLSTAMAGVVGEHAVKGSPAALKEIGEGSVGAVRAGGRGMQKLAPHVPGAAAALGVISGVEGGPASMYFRGKGAGYLGKYVAEPFERGANAMATFRMPIKDKNVEILTVNAAKADKAAKKAADDHAVYAASEEHGAIDPETNPAYKKSMETLNKAKDAQAEAHFHLQEAKRAAQEAAANKSAIEGEGKEITPAEVNAARPETSTPTNEELNTRQNKLMSDIEKKAGVEQPAPTPENVKLPGQVQPETFPQEPTEAPRVDETTRMRPLGGDKGVLVGRKPLQLGEGTSEAAPAAPEAPKAPLGEILPPEKPAKPGRLGTLKATGGNVIDTEPEVQQKLEEGLSKGSKEAKPVALKPLGKVETAPLGGKIETPEPVAEAPKVEAPKAEAPKKTEEKVERTPEDDSKIQRLLADHTDQELLREAKRRGIDEADYDLSKREGPNRHRVDRERLISDIMGKIPDTEKDNLVRLSNEFDSKDSTTWTDAEKSNLNRAQRARAIMQEHTGGPKPVSGGSQGAETAGSEESSEKDRAHFAQAKQELPNGTISEQLLRAQELKEQAAKPKEPKGVYKPGQAEPEDEMIRRGAKPLDIPKSADEYNEKQGLPPVKHEELKPSPRSKEIAKAYDDMKHDPDNPEVKKSYNALIDDVKKQWDHATKDMGIKIEPTDTDPYKTHEEMMDDVKNNHRLKVFRGGNPLEEGHPLAEVDPETGERYNTMFRAVHDLFGHASQGNDFSEAGEERAWNNHRQMMSPEAVPAMTTETRGQVASYFANGNEFPAQKAGVLPDFTMEKGNHPEEIAKLHNEGGGSTFNPVKGDMGGADAYAVPAHPELSRVIDGEKVTPEQVKQYMEIPEVKKALAEDRNLSVGTWANDGKTYFDLSATVPDKAEAIDLAKKNDQKAITYLKTREEIPTGGKGTGTPLEEPKVTKPEHASGEWTEYPNKPVREMTDAEKEALASKGASGGSQSADEKISKALIKHASKYADAVGKVEQGRNDLRFILNDGSALYTDQPHYIVSEMALEKSKLPIGMNEDDNTHDFMNRTGSVRIAGENGFHVEAKPTPEQIKSLATLAKGQKVYFTVGDTEGQGSFGDFQRAVDKEFPEKSEAFKSVKNMTEAEKEALAAKGQSGASGKEEKQKLMPTGDDLIKKYGESSGDPAHTSFILPDGRGVDLPHGVDHDTMLGGKATDQVPRREQFIDQGNIRIRPRVGKGGREFSVSIPESGITENQLSYLKKMAPQMSSGTVMVEIGKRGGAYKEIPYGKASADLESTLRALAPIKEAEKRLPDLAEKHLTPEERQGVTKSPQQQEKFLQRMEQMPEVREWADAASKGAGERKWYQRSTQAFDAMSKEAPEYFDQPGDRDKFIGMLASGSPQQSVAMSMREALRVWTNYVDNGRPTGPALEKLLSKSSEKGGFTLPGAKIPNAMKALAGEPLWPDITKNSHFKVPSFRDNLTGMLDRVTNDGWMALFAGLDAKDISKAHSYHPLSVMTRAAAEELGWEPAEAQAAIWVFIKTLTEKGVDASEDPHEMRQHSEDFADIILHDPETRALLKDMGVDHAKLDERLAREVEQKPEPDSGRKSPTGEDSARRAFERVETARGKGTIPPPKTGLLKFGEPEPDEATSFNPEEIESGKGPKQLTKNASGESSASQEAINRAKSEKKSGTKYFRIDSRSGREIPIIGADALDAKAGPYEHIVRRGPDGEVTLDSGKKARPLGRIKGR